MTPLRAVIAALRLSARRVASRRSLTLAVILAMAALVGVWVGIPLYAESASSRLLTEQVEEADADTIPFGYLFSFNRLSGGNQTWEAIEPVNGYLEGPDTVFGASVRRSFRFVESTTFDLSLGGAEAAPTDPDAGLGRFGFSSLSSEASAPRIVSGRMATTGSLEGEPIEVVISEGFADELGLSVGQSLTVTDPRARPDVVPVSTSVVVTGVWAAPQSGADTEVRFFNSGAMQRSLVVPEATMSTAVDALVDGVVSGAQWVVLLDSSSVTTDDVDGLLAQTDRVNRAVDDRLSGTRLLVSPASSLSGFRDQVDRLDDGLSSFAVPTLALVVVVVGLLVSASWRRRATEISMLRSRGVPSAVILAAAFVESIIVAVMAAALGLGFARVVATAIGRTETFLDLGRGVDLDLVFNSRTVQSLGTGVLVLVVLHMLPGLGVLQWSRNVGRRVSETRVAKPWWQRTYADVVIMVVIVAFAWFVLASTTISGDLLDDPVVILLPAALSIAAGLAVLRVFPWVMSIGARLLERSNLTATLLVARRAARVSGGLAAPLMLLVITGALSIYTASLARTLDLQLVDRAHHIVGGANSIEDDVGADRFAFELVNGNPVRSVGATGPVIGPAAYGQIWGLESATRVAQLPGRAEGVGGGAPIPIEFTGIDPESFASTAFWRGDYASRSLADLLERLRATPDAVLMHRAAMVRNNLEIGDTIRVTVSVGDRGVDAPMVIVGHFRQFPTWSPASDLAPVVAVLSDFEQRLGRSVARRVIFERDDALVDAGQTRADFNRLGIGSASIVRADDVIEREQQRPERQGVFGLLTVSFALSVVLTVLGFVFYAAFGFTQQSTELGMLRALGLGLPGLMAIVGLDLLLVTLAGVGGAIAAGVAMSSFVLPRLVGTSAGSTPELLAEIDWATTLAIPALLFVAFVVVTGSLLATLRRMRLFEAVKIGADS